MFTFGQIATDQSDVNADLVVSDDRRALTVSFSGFEVTADTGKSPTALSTRLFSLVIPVEGYDNRLEIEFGVSAFVATSAGGTASLVVNVNGQTTVADFPTADEKDFVQPLKLTADSATECRLLVLLVAGRGSKDASAAALLSVPTIDAEILPRPPQPSGRKM
jgi:hypothetical protein